MAKILFFVAAALLIVSACAARSPPAAAQLPPAAEGVVLAATDSLGNATYSINDLPSRSCGDSWPSCMSDVLDQAAKSPFCNKACNILIYRTALQFKRVIVTDRNLKQDHVKIGSHYFNVFYFHGPAYYETTGWYGWPNWGFSGKFSHAVNTGILEFFQN